MLNKFAVTFLMASVVSTSAHAFKLPVPALGGASASASADSSVSVPDEAAQERLVRQFATAQSHTLNAQIAFANAFGLADQVKLLEAEKIAISSGAISKEALEKALTTGANAKAQFEKISATQPQLSAESKAFYVSGLGSLAESVIASKDLGVEASNFANGLKSLNPLQAAKLSSKLSAGLWVATTTPGFIKDTFSTTKQAITYAKASKISVPANVDKLEF